MNKFAIKLGYCELTEDFPVSDFEEASVASARQEFAVKCRRIYSNDQIEANHVRVIDYLLLGSPIRPTFDSSTIPDTIRNLRPANIDCLAIVRLFLEKIEILTETERRELIQTIKLMNCPMFIVGKKDTSNIGL